MICSRCKKRMAVVFITKVEGENTVNEGLCLQCATELGIKPINEMVQQMGINPEDLEKTEEELAQLMNPDGDDEFDPARTQQAFPFLQNIFGGAPKDDTKEKGSANNKKENKRKYLDSYCVNLTKKAIDGKLDRVIGREKELSRIIQILNRRTKNNPCLIGEPGVGKTAVVEALAQKIADKDVPAKLYDKEIYMLDLTALVAGTQFRGQFESRIKGLIDEVKRLGNIVLFIDEVHNLVSAGDAEGSMNAANILKPALSRGEIQVVGATTFAEYRKYIEKDSALERRFQPVTVDEPSLDNAVEILRGIKNYYETYHGVIIDDETVKMAVKLSERYITDRFLPDKAIDLIDEAASSVNISDENQNARYICRREIDAETKILETLEAQSPDDYESIAKSKSKLAQLEQNLAVLEANKRILSISIESLAKVIELWTGIPANKIKEDEYEKIITLEDTLKKRIVGQDHAVEAVVRAIKRNRAGISPKRKPVSFIFAGPTGVGKTELVKQLSSAMFDSPETFIRLDMSEFMEKHSVSKIIGAPPGYVGYDEAGQLTEKIRRKPYSIVLFDEIEKAHPDVLNIRLQILDDGRITDAHGRTVNFENTIVVMTTNAGSEIREGKIGFSESAQNMVNDKTMKALEQIMRPEFINRVDEIITFNQLSKENFAGISAIMLGELKKSLAEKNISLEWDSEVEMLLVDKSYSAKYGARNLRRVIEKEVEDKIASIIIDDFSKIIETVTIFTEGNEIFIKIK